MGQYQEMPPRLQGPRVVVPPPLVFAAGWVAAWALNRQLPFDIDGSGGSVAQQSLAVLLMTTGFGLMVWGIVTFVRARTPVIPVKEARILVTSGPFRFSRNPMYVGLAAAYVGLAILLNQAWPLVMLPVVLAVLTKGVVQREERYLRSVFQQDYDRYCQRVRRWC